MKTILGLMVLAVAGAAFAQTPVGNAEAAKAKTSMCEGCHGVPGYRTASPHVYHVPKIGGQQPVYLVNAQSGVSDATIYSAFGIADDQLAEIVPALEKRFARRLKATVVEAPELIGGIRVVVGDEVLDTSVKARLEQMKVALTA